MSFRPTEWPSEHLHPATPAGGNSSAPAEGGRYLDSKTASAPARHGGLTPEGRPRDRHAASAHAEGCRHAPMRSASTLLTVTALIVPTLVAPAVAQQVKFEKYKLPNDMTVILHEDHALPTACVNLWYYVGSKDEADRRSGFAHLFEHLMFMGTRRVPNGQFDVVMEKGGGFNNASTSEDRTNYFSFGPANLLPTLLWLDADRLEDLGKEMNLEKLNLQRDVVRNERRQTSEMQPYGKADLLVPELMYPKEHPYGHTVIGSHEDLEAATVDDVKNFFATYYVPCNATLVVAGDFKSDEIKPLVNKLFGTLPRGNDPVHKSAAPVTLKEVKRITCIDQVQFARTTLVYHSPARFKDGDAEMDLVADILASGKSSRLYKRLVFDDKIATDINAYQASMYLGSLFYINVTAKPEVTLDRIEQVVDEELARLLKDGPTADELKRNQVSKEVGMIASLQSLLNKADALNEYNFYLGTPDGFETDLNRYRNATVAGITSWARKTLTPDARLILRVLPAGEPVEDNPREAAPALADAGAFAPQMPETFTLSNGIEVQHWRKNELPLVNVSLLLNGGAECDDPAKIGTTFLTAQMLEEGAGDKDALAFSDALDMLGASFSSTADQESVNVGLSVLRRNLDAALALYADAIVRPRMTAADWDRIRNLHIDDLTREEDEPTIVAARVGMRAYFGDAHPYGRPIGGTIGTVEKLTLDDIKACHTARFTPANARLLVAGDLTADEAKAALEKALGAWKTPADWKPTVPARANDPRHASQSLVIVDKPGSVQTVIRFFMPGPVYKTPDRVALSMMNTILGGSFTSRLNQNLREKNGYTYGARSSFTMAPTTGYFSAGANVKAETTGPALKEFLAEFNSLRTGGVTPDEAAKAAQQERTETIQAFQGLRGILATAAVLDRNGLPFSTIGEDLGTIGRVDAARLSALAKNAAPFESGVLILVGDKKLILEQIKDLKLPAPKELTVRGEPK